MKRHERPAIGVDQDYVPGLAVAHQKRAAVRHHRAQPRGLAELEILAGQLDDILVELDRQNTGVGQGGAEIGHSAPATQANFHDALHLRRIGNTERHQSRVVDRQCARVAEAHAAFGVIALVLPEGHGDGVFVTEDENVVVERLARLQEALGRGRGRHRRGQHDDYQPSQDNSDHACRSFIASVARRQNTAPCGRRSGRVRQK